MHPSAVGTNSLMALVPSSDSFPHPNLISALLSPEPHRLRLKAKTAQLRHPFPTAPTPPIRPSLTAHLEAPWTQQSTLLKVKKTQPPSWKTMLQPLFSPQAFGVFTQKSQNFPSQEVPGRKSVPWSSATPQTRENKANAGISSPEWLQHPRLGSRIRRLQEP